MIKYISPLTKDGKVQHIPCVIKNRDFLIGCIETFYEISSSLVDLIDLEDEEVMKRISPKIDSSRFDGFINDGVHSSEVSDEEFENNESEKLEDILNAENEHSENKPGMFESDYFGVECSGCGNYISFKTAKDIPEETFKCDICDRILIMYIGFLDDEIE